jgi:hypothetical protein
VLFRAGSGQQVRSGGVVWLVVVEADAGERGEPGCGAGERVHGDGPIQRDDRVRLDRIELVVQREDLGPIAVVGGGRVGVNGGDRGLDLKRSGLVAPQARTDQRMALLDELGVPARTVLVGEANHRTARVETAGPTGLAQQHQRQQSTDLRLVGHERGEDPPDADRFRGEFDARESGAGAGGMCFGVDEIDRHQDAVQPSGSAAASGIRYGAWLSRSLRFARTMRWTIVASGRRKPRAISPVCRPPSRRRVSATCASAASAGWQQRLPFRVGVRVGVVRVHVVGGDVAFNAGRFPAKPIDRAVTCGGGDPPARVRRDPPPRPLLGGDREGLRHRVLGQLNVAKEADQGRGAGPRFPAEYSVEGVGHP